MRCSPRIVGAVAASLTVPMLGVTALAGTAGAAQSATSLYNSALHSATSEGVHYVSKATEQGVTITVVGDTGVTSGQQTLKLQKGTLIENVTVNLIGSTGYVKANAAALVNILGLTAAESGHLPPTSGCRSPRPTRRWPSWWPACTTRTWPPN